MGSTDRAYRALRQREGVPAAHKQVGLTPRWTPMAYHETQQRFARSDYRFKVLVKGRRSGGTELSKRIVVAKAYLGSRHPHPRYFCAAPTHSQATRIFWRDIKALIAPADIRRISESEKFIELVNGAEIWVTGLDKPERVEGTPWDGCIITEVANVRSTAWPEHIRPALTDRSGWAILESAPEGRNHFYELDREARQQMRELGPRSDWAAFHWRSEEVLPLYGKVHEIAQARRDMDEMTYEQEFGANFLNFQGRAYYPYDESLHNARLDYDPDKPLIFCFDFNVEPGVACVCQEMKLPPPAGQVGTGVIGEVWVERNSNTVRICDLLHAHWRDHRGAIVCYGDASGGARSTSQVEGTDWDLIRSKLRESFGPRVSFRVPKDNPPVRARVNAVNSRLMSVDGGIRMMIDPEKAPHVVLDLEGVTRDAEGNIDKQKHKDDGRTHMSDGLGYYVAYRFPLKRRQAVTVPMDEAFWSA